MANLSITAANVVPQDGSKLEYGTAGTAVTAGQWVYLDELSTGKYLLADDNSGTAAARKARGLAVNAAASGQPLTIVREGPVSFGTIFTAGVAYYLSATPGAMAPIADLTTGDFPCLLGMASTTSIFNVKIQAPGVSL